MEAFFLYLMKSALCLALFYPFYMLLMSRETFHRFNRFALISILLASLLIPVFRITIHEPMLISEWYQRWESWITGRPITESENIVIEQLQYEMVTTDISPIETLPIQSELSWIDTLQYHWAELLFTIYLLGVLFLIIKHIISLIRLFQLISGSRQKVIGNKTILALHQKEKLSPFSWMRYIVMSQQDYIENGKQIVAHEQAHISLHHSIDLILVEICAISQWFNPIVWLLKQELQNIHEYEADETVIKQGIDAKQYQLLIIKKAVGARLYSIANSLNHSSLKKRLTMMMKQKSNPWARLKYFYILPLAAISMVAFAYPDHSTNELNGKVSDLFVDTETNEVKSVENQNEEKSIMLKGKVLNALTKKAMHGASVIETGTGNGTIADAEGYFSLKTTVGREIHVSHVGMKHLKFIASEENNGKTFEMEEEPGKMTDITVVGYGDNAGNEKAPSKQTPKGINTNLPEKTFSILIDNKGEYKYGLKGETLVSGSLSDIANYIENTKEKNKVGNNILSYKAELKVDKEAPQESIDKLKETLRKSYVLQINIGSNEDTNIDKSKSSIQTKATSNNDDEVFMVVEEMPEYPGGMGELMKFLAQNIRYPQEARKSGIEGRVIVQMVINESGKVMNPTILKSVSPELDAEAIRVVELLPNWKPGRQRGKAVSVKFTIPIQFKLSKPQGNDSQQQTSSTRAIPKTDENGVYQAPDKMPQFPGGNGELMKFLAQNVRYPKEAQANGIQGRVIVQFIVDRTGKAKDFKVTKSVSPEIDAEAVRVLSEMPLWTPGEDKGEKIDTKFTLPVMFRLDSGRSEKTPTVEGDIFMVVENMPEFPGGAEHLYGFIRLTMRYPQVAKEKKMEGRVIVQTIITKEGKLVQPTVVKSVSPELDAEALRIVKAMPDWKPGTQRGKAVNVKYNIPIQFSLED